MPGIPVDVAPPPAPPNPPVVAPAAAAGGAALGPVLLPAIAGIAGGLYLGYEVKKDIDRFKRKAVLPFYDTDYTYGRGQGQRVSPHWQDGPSIDRWWEYEADLPPWDAWVWTGGPQDLAHQQGWASGWGGTWLPPVSPTVHWEWANCSGGANITHWRAHGASPSPCPAIPGGFATLVGPAPPPAQYWYPASTVPFPGAVNSFTALDLTFPAGSPLRNVGSWNAVIDGAAPPNETLPMRDNVTTQGFAWPLESPLFEEAVGTPWRQAVAPPGTQPSVEEPVNSPSPSREVEFQPIQLPGIVNLLPVTGVGITVPDQVVVVAPTTPAPQPSGPPPVILRPPPDATYPEPARGKERKINVRSVAGTWWIAINIATEVFDFMESLHRALPKHLQRKPKKRGGRVPPEEMAQAIYEHFGQIDVSRAIQNFANNQIEDMYYGLQGQAGKRLNQLSGASTGGGSALRQGADHAPGGMEGPPELTLDQLGLLIG